MAKDKDIKIERDTFLDEKPPPQFAGALQEIRIKKLEDLVHAGAISSDEMLEKLLGSAKDITSKAISERDTYIPPVRVPGTIRPDQLGLK